MLNCKTLTELTSIFENILIVYKSKTKSKQFQEAYDLLTKLIKNRTLHIEDDQFQNDKYDEKLYVKSKSKNIRNIKTNSKFGQHFLTVGKNTKLIENDDVTLNEYYNPKFVKFLQDFFMPYCFLWSGLVLKGLNISRVNNGSLEKYIGHKKSKLKSLEPSDYVNQTYLSTKGRVIDFENHLNRNNENDDFDSDENCSDDEDVSGDEDNYDECLIQNVIIYELSLHFYLKPRFLEKCL